MIQASNHAGGFQATFSNSGSTATADLPIAKGGQSQGFGPHELIEAGLATCMVITARMYAIEHGWPLSDAFCQVGIERTATGDVTFVYSVILHGLNQEQEQKLSTLLSQCPVAKTLSKPATMRLERINDPPSPSSESKLR